MPAETEYSLQELADLAGVTPRTIRYYIAQGLLASPGRVGPGATYTDGHLNRLRLIRRLQHEHLPLAEIRSRLASLDDATVAALVEAHTTEPPAGSAIDYIRGVLGGDVQLELAPRAASAPERLSLSVSSSPQANAAENPTPERSQWDRILLAPDVELHVRRPLGRRVHKQVERLIQIARELLEEDQP